jgi:hypothetical protein
VTWHVLPQDLHRGDLLKIVWADIAEDSTGDPDKAALSARTSYGIFWCRREDRGLYVLITTTTLDDDVSGQNGYCIYPEAVVLELEVVKRARRPRKPRTRTVDDIPEVKS